MGKSKQNRSTAQEGATGRAGTPYEKIRTYAALAMAIFMGLTLLLGSAGILTKFLPTTEAVRKVIKEEGGTIAKESVEKISYVVIECQKDLSGARNTLYENVFTNKEIQLKGYVCQEAPKLHVTSHLWKNTERGNKRLLIDNERILIKEIIGDNLKGGNIDQRHLMNLVLGDSRIIRGILKDTFLSDRVIDSELVHLSPYEKIVVIGGYIGELILENALI